MAQAVLAIVALAGFTQPNVQATAPEAWICRAAKQLAGASIIELTQVVDPGDGKFPVQVELRVQAAGGFQSFRWTLTNSASRFRESRSASLSLKMKRRLRSGNIVLSNSDQTIQMPITFENFTPAYQGQAWIVLQGSDSLRPFWANSHWQVSVVDGRGRVQAMTKVEVPSAQSLNEAAAQLSPELQTKTSDPASHCEELGPDASI